jgi:hypothetical protein
VASPSPSTLYEINFIVRNQAKSLVLMRGICHVSKRRKEGNFITDIPFENEASVKVKAEHIIAGSIDCCLVYEIVRRGDESEPLMEWNYQVFIAVRVFARPIMNKYKASVVIFRAKRGRFTGSEDDIKQLKEVTLRKRLVNNTYLFECGFKDWYYYSWNLRLEVVFQPGKQAIIEVTLKWATRDIGRTPVVFK